MRFVPKSIWPYYILDRDDESLKLDVQQIADRLSGRFDTVVFIPNAGVYLHDIFISLFGDRYRTEFLTIRRRLSVSGTGFVKSFVFRRRWLSNIMRHVEVALRLIKAATPVKRKRIVDRSVGFDVKGCRVLVIDDSVDSGATMEIAKDLLVALGAKEVITACVSNHLMPRRVFVDFSVYQYALLRTRNSKDYASK